MNATLRSDADLRTALWIARWALQADIAYGGAPGNRACEALRQIDEILRTDLPPIPVLTDRIHEPQPAQSP